VTETDLLRHVISLATAFDVRLVMDTDKRVNPETEDQTGAAGFGFSLEHPEQIVQCMVHVPFVMDERSYAVALHELGHTLSPTGCLWQHMDQRGKIPTFRNLNLLLEQEDAAWEWARRYAIHWTLAMESYAKDARDSYRIYCDRLRLRLVA
jgi:hypothetical protein